MQKNPEFNVGSNYIVAYKKTSKNSSLEFLNAESIHVTQDLPDSVSGDIRHKGSKITIPKNKIFYVTVESGGHYVKNYSRK